MNGHNWEEQIYAQKTKTNNPAGQMECSLNPKDLGIGLEL